ncbi:equilibrative nucleoside transporter, partial [Striga asiatica]
MPRTHGSSFIHAKRGHLPLFTRHQPFVLGTMAILAYFEPKIDTRKRNLFGYILFCISTFRLLVIELATSGKGGIGNYISICAFVASFGVANALIQGGLIGDLAFMCLEFFRFFAGLAASGALTSGLRLITKAAFDKTENDLRKGVIMFLAISTFFEFICIFLYAFVFGNLPIVKNFRKKAALEGSKTVSADLAVTGIHTSDGKIVKNQLLKPTYLRLVDDPKQARLGNKELLLQNIDYALDLYLIFIFPGFLYENTGNHQLGSWYAVVLIAITIHSPYRLPKSQIQKGPHVHVPVSILSHPVFLLHGKIWRPRMNDIFGVFYGTHKRIFSGLCADRGSQRVQAPEQNALGNLLVVYYLPGYFQAWRSTGFGSLATVHSRINTKD